MIKDKKNKAVHHLMVAVLGLCSPGTGFVYPSLFPRACNRRLAVSSIVRDAVHWDDIPA